MAAARTSSASRSSTSKGGLAWTDAELAPVVLVAGAESLFAERAVDQMVAQARSADPQVEVTRWEAAGYDSGMLEMVASPSLFGESRLIVIGGVESTNDAFLTDALAYLEAPAEDVWVVLVHGGGVRGKKLLDAVRASGCPVIACDPIKKDAEKADFVSAEFKRGKRRIEPAAIRALVDAVGSDLRELAASCSQLIADTDGPVSEAMVAQYHGGRVEATGFRVADAAVAGNTGEAVALLRHALATGADPVPLVTALASKLRTLAKVAAMRGRGSDAAKTLGLAPWLVDKANRELNGWTPEGLATAITAVATADAEVKGASRDPVFAIERAVIVVSKSHGRARH